MGRRKGIPSYCLHRASGRAVCRVNGRDHYLGAYGSPESRRAYAELIARLEAGAEAAPAQAPTVAVLADRYLDFATLYYVKGGRPTRQLERVERSLGITLELYGSTPADAFGPLALEAVRSRMVGLGWSRRHVNACVGCVRRAWRWAAARQLVTAAAFQALCTLDGLRAGRTAARETPPVGPVTDDAVLATLAHLRPETADMVRLQRLTAMRAGEVCALRAEEIDRSADVWTWSVSGHKMAHAGRARVIYFGPRAQALLAPYLASCPDGYVFSPIRTLANLHRELRSARRTPVQPSQACRVQPRRKRPPGECYTSNSYQRAIRTACDRAGVPRWSSHQLRKAAATEIRREFGIEAAQELLGHARLDTVQLYAAKNVEAALAAVRRAG